MEQEGRPAEQKQPRAITIWLVEDSTTDAFVIGEVLRHSRIPFNLTVMTDGDAALVRLHRVEAGDLSAIPDLVLLDLNLPKVSGIQVLAALRHSPSCGAVPVVVVTSSDSASDMKAIGDLGVTSYFRKPHSLDAFMSLSEVIKGALMR
ncbi:MAG: response regulator [Candidatus Solibacter sp.]